MRNEAEEIIFKLQKKKIPQYEYEFSYWNVCKMFSIIDTHTQKFTFVRSQNSRKKRNILKASKVRGKFQVWCDLVRNFCKCMSLTLSKMTSEVFGVLCKIVKILCGLSF